MPLKNFETVGVLQGYEYLRGVITKIYHSTDTCDLTAKVLSGITEEGVASFSDQEYSSVPIYYHCKEDATERENGAITGAAWAFSVDDEVIVLRQKSGAPGVAGDPKVFVIGFPDGARRCVPCVVVVSTQSGEEAVAWDLVNDDQVLEATDRTSLLSQLNTLGLTEQTECNHDDAEIRWACVSTSVGSAIDLCPLTCNRPTLSFRHTSYIDEGFWPSWNIEYLPDPDASIDPPYSNNNYIGRYVGTSAMPGPGYMDSDGECPSSYYGTNGVQYLFWQNPHDDDAIMVPGPWLSLISGSLHDKHYEKTLTAAPGSVISSILRYTGGWQTIEWDRELPHSDAMLYGSDSSGIININGVRLEYFFFRSLFDYEFDTSTILPVSSSTVTELTVPALQLAAKELYCSGRDGSYRLFSEINIASWLAAGFKQSAYDSWEASDQDFFNTYGVHSLILFPVWTEQADGLAINGDTSVFFEFCGLYPDALEFYDDGQVWDAEKLAKYKREFRIHYHHPFPKKNMDAILFKRINDLREEAGEVPLKWNWNLYEAAKKMSDDMATRKDLEPLHVGSDGSTIQERTTDAFFFGFYNPYPWAVGGTPLSPTRQYTGGENVIAGPVGLKWPLANFVDNTIGGDSIESHTINGIKVTHSGDGWKQSSGHYANIIYDRFYETGITTTKGADGLIYATQTFGGRGDGITWNGFSSFNPENMLAFIDENFTFDKADEDRRRKPRIWLCTIPQD